MEMQNHAETWKTADFRDFGPILKIPEFQIPWHSAQKKQSKLGSLGLGTLFWPPRRGPKSTGKESGHNYHTFWSVWLWKNTPFSGFLPWHSAQKKHDFSRKSGNFFPRPLFLNPFWPDFEILTILPQTVIFSLICWFL